MEALNNLLKNRRDSSSNARATSSRAANVPIMFSEWSSPAVRDSGWACHDLMLGAGMVIIQPSTNRVVVVDEVITVDVGVMDGGNAIANAQAKGKGKANVGAKRETKPMTYNRRSFLPRGRKDKGESVEQTALREAFEESGYEVSAFPLYTRNRQPPPSHDEDADFRPNTEAVYHTMQSWGPRYRHGECIDNGGEYLVAWFVGQIPENPIHHKGVGMPDEQNYVPRLLPPRQAYDVLSNPMEKRVLQYALHVYSEHVEYVELLKQWEEEEVKEQANAEANAKVEAEAGDGVGLVSKESTARAPSQFRNKPTGSQGDDDGDE